MPIIKSAIKRVRQMKARTVQNSSRKRLNKEKMKEFLTLVETGKLEEAVKLFSALQKSIDLMVKNNLWHKNKAARQKSNLAKLIKDAKGAPTKATAGTAAKAPAKKAAPKKPAAKKAPAKKPAAKKTAKK